MSTQPIAASSHRIPTTYNTPDEPRAVTSPRLAKLGIYTPDSHDQLCRQDARTAFIVEGVIAADSIGIAVGDSGIGKSPLFYQLMLCVAAGIPWLGMPTVASPVLYIDGENGPLNSKVLRDALSRHLGLKACPENFHYSFGPSDLNELGRRVARVRPALVVIDTLRAFDPTIEQDNTTAGTLIQSLRRLTKTYGTAFLLIHHTRKKNDKPGATVFNIETTPVMTWMEQACGARALINQTDLRMAIDRSPKNPNVLVVRAALRVRGDVGTFHLIRILDGDGEPIGYVRQAGVQFLENPDHQKCFAMLPQSFSFKDAKDAYGKKDEATDGFLKKCISVGIVRKVVKGRYEKVAQGPAE
jgi:hypothetical protein